MMRLLLLLLFLRLSCACEQFAELPTECAPYLTYPLSYVGLNSTQALAANTSESKLSLLSVLGSSCYASGVPAICGSFFRKCFLTNVTLANGTAQLVEYASPPCRSSCEAFLAACPAVAASSQAPNCSALPLDGTTESVFLSDFNVTLDVPCFVPSSANSSAPAVQCYLPLVPSADNTACLIRCPYPQYPDSDWDVIWTIQNILPFITLTVLVLVFLPLVFDPQLRLYPSSAVLFFVAGMMVTTIGVIASLIFGLLFHIFFL